MLPSTELLAEKRQEDTNEPSSKTTEKDFGCIRHRNERDNEAHDMSPHFSGTSSDGGDGDGDGEGEERGPPQNQKDYEEWVKLCQREQGQSNVYHDQEGRSVITCEGDADGLGNNSSFLRSTLLDVHKGKPIRLQVKVLVPVSDHPNFNFVGKLLGPKGNSLKWLQEQTQTKMAILGRGSMRDKHKEEALRRQGDARYFHLNEDLHVEITAFAPAPEAYTRIGHAMHEDYYDDIRQQQLRELGILNSDKRPNGKIRLYPDSVSHPEEPLPPPPPPPLPIPPPAHPLPHLVVNERQLLPKPSPGLRSSQGSHHRAMRDMDTTPAATLTTNCSHPGKIPRFSNGFAENLNSPHSGDGLEWVETPDLNQYDPWDQKNCFKISRPTCKLRREKPYPERTNC